MSGLPTELQEPDRAGPTLEITQVRILTFYNSQLYNIDDVWSVLYIDRYILCLID